MCQPPERYGDQPQPGGGGAHAGRPGLRGHVPGGHPVQAGQRGAQGARPCCLSTIYHLIPIPFSILTILLFSELNLKVLPAYQGFDCFHFLPLLYSFQKLMGNVWKNGKNLWDGKYRSITSWICSNMEMESHIYYYLPPPPPLEVSLPTGT